MTRLARELPPNFIPHSAQLRNVWLRSVEFSENGQFDPSQSIAYSLDVDHEIREGEEDKSSLSYIDVSLSIVWSVSEGGATTEAPFDLSIKMTGAFEWPALRPDEHRREWTEYNGVYLVWPYLRACVATITEFSSLPTFTLPTLAVPRPEPWAETGEHEVPAQQKRSPSESDAE